MGEQQRKVQSAVKIGEFKKFLEQVKDQDVEVKYELVTSSDVYLATVYMGYTKIDLVKDQDPANQDQFSSVTPYRCTLKTEGLRIIVIASGHAGASWQLKVEMKKSGDPGFSKIKDSPITMITDEMGHLDHNGFHN